MSKIYIVGIGPGEYESMTIKAQKVLKSCDLIIGYTVYINLVKDYFPDKEFLKTPMKKEADRCIMAFEEAEKGKNVAVICSGDAGIYGMTGLMYELSERYPGIEIESVSGVSAMISGAGIIGAPISHDFAVISLSDLLTPWDKIQRRLKCAAQGDFVICIYNPSSKKRNDYLEKACDILLQYKMEKTICAIAQNIGREGERTVIMTLKELKNTKVDMFTTVFIGNSQTKIVGGKMVTPRGYRYE